jgi:hypothetical protein
VRDHLDFKAERNLRKDSPTEAEVVEQICLQAMFVVKVKWCGLACLVRGHDIRPRCEIEGEKKLEAQRALVAIEVGS